MAIYDESKLYDNIHIQKKTPNPQIYALFEMGKELEEQGGGSSVTVDSALSSTSENPVQNKVITNALQNKANTSDLATVATTGSYTDLSNKPTIDSAMSSSSENAVQNKVINDAINDMVAGIAGSTYTASTYKYKVISAYDGNTQQVGNELETARYYTGTGSNEDGAMTQKAITDELNDKAETDLSNINVGSANSGKYFTVASDGSLSLITVTQETWTFTLSDSSTVTRTVLIIS